MLTDRRSVAPFFASLDRSTQHAACSAFDVADNIGSHEFESQMMRFALLVVLLASSGLTLAAPRDNMSRWLSSNGAGLTVEASIDPGATMYGCIAAVTMRSDPVTYRACATRHHCNDGVGHRTHHDQGSRPAAEAPSIAPPTWAAALGGVSGYRDEQANCQCASLRCKT